MRSVPTGCCCIGIAAPTSPTVTTWACAKRCGFADRDPEGEPKVSNGLALCKLHHAAFDCHIIGVNPDYRVEVRVDVLEEIDGPMLEHGLQGFHRGQPFNPTVVARPNYRPIWSSFPSSSTLK